MPIDVGASSKGNVNIEKPGASPLMRGRHSSCAAPNSPLAPLYIDALQSPGVARKENDASLRLDISTAMTRDGRLRGNDEAGKTNGGTEPSDSGERTSNRREYRLHDYVVHAD